MLHEGVAIRLRFVAIAIGAIAGTALSGCGGSALPFEPVHPSSAVATYPGTSYDLSIGSAPVGEATVWSEGATGASAGDHQVLNVEMTIHNATNAPIRLDVANTSVNVTTRSGHLSPLTVPARVRGSETAPPQSSTRVGLNYELPPGVKASTVTRFDFNWRVSSPSGIVAESTPFVPVPAPEMENLASRIPCNGYYRVTNIDDCLIAPPATSQPLR